DIVKAVKLYRQAAEQGHADAQFNSAAMYANGEGIELDNVEAVKWYCQAAEQGHAAAQFNLGEMYANGDGITEDTVIAYMWFNLAASQDYEDAKENKGMLSERMTREQIAEAQKLSREWLAKHSK
ncbi:sel1 repeat family protein, partial [Opitutales bacterium]|nr:sel1 repeat family protein [Opitutales bacterium]